MLAMWSYARYHLRLSRDELFACTPRQYDWLCKQHKQETITREFLFGQVAQTTANFSMRAPDKGYEVTRFMPSQRENKLSVSDNHKRVAQQMDFLLALHSKKEKDAA